MKQTFAAKTFAAWTFRAGAWAGVGTDEEPAAPPVTAATLGFDHARAGTLDFAHTHAGTLRFAHTHAATVEL